MRGGKRPNSGRKSSEEQRKLKETRARTNQNLIPYKPGESGNPEGRKTAGATLREWFNSLAERGLTEAEVRAIAKDRNAPWPKRSAALRVLRTLEDGDLADMQAFIDGDASLVELREKGVNTAIVKKAKARVRTFTNQDGGTETTIEREIELHDRAGADFDRVSDRTEGKPTQRVEVKDDGGTLRTPADGAALLAAACAGLAKRLGLPDPGRAGGD